MVVKRGRGCVDQREYLRVLKEQASWLFPSFEDVHNGYVMEKLDRYEPEPSWPVDICKELERSLWCRPPLKDYGEWKMNLYRTLDIEVAPWSHVVSRRCLTHGDPTLCNTMRRGSQMVLIDPVPPCQRVPQICEIDQARILQSMLGWELMTGCMTQQVQWEMPPFITEATDTTLRRLFYWTGVMMARVHQGVQERWDREAEWALHLRGEMFRAAGV